MTDSIHLLDVNKVPGALGADIINGLTEKEAGLRLAKYGRNTLKQAKNKSIIRKLFNRFKDITFIALAGSAAVLSIAGHQAHMAFIIAALLCVKVIISVVSENSTDKAVRILHNAYKPAAVIKRDAETCNMDVRKITVGDTVLLERGGCVPADIRLIESVSLTVDESAVTGIDGPADKTAAAMQEKDPAPGDKKNIAYMGSTVISGRGTGVVFATGMNTILGRKHVPQPDTGTAGITLFDRLNSAAKSLSILCIIICAVIFAAGIIFDLLNVSHERGIINMLVLSLALCVAAAPGEITAAASFIIAAGVRDLIKTGIIIKNIKTAITLGKTAVICTSKTGVLTENRMTITRVADSKNVYEVTGVGYKPKGHVVAEIMISRNIALMSEIAVLCNDAEYDAGNAQITGDPTEGAMLVFGAKLGHDKHALGQFRPRILEIPFDRERKIMSTYNRDGERVMMYTKGAAEEVIDRCSYVYLDGVVVFMSDAIAQKLKEQAAELAAGALRVLACAYKVYESEQEIDNLEQDLIFVGMMAMTDMLRGNLKESAGQCADMGVTVKMLTGDHKETAGAIARQLGIIGEGDEILSGVDIDAMPDETLVEKAKEVNVFARVTPEQKMKITAALKAGNNAAIAFAGADAGSALLPAKADIYIAMGLTGEEAARKRADIIIADDRFSGIVQAVLQGRTIYTNIRKAMKYMLSFCIGLVLLIFFTTVVTLPVPLSPQQLLFASVLTGFLPALAIGRERTEEGTVFKRPRNPEESILNRKVLAAGVVRALFVFAGALMAYLYGYFIAVNAQGIRQPDVAMSMCFFTLTAGQLLVAYPSKTDRFMASSGTILKNGRLNLIVLLCVIVLMAVIYMPGLNTLMAATALNAVQLIICTVLVVLTALSVEISKLYIGQ